MTAVVNAATLRSLREAKGWDRQTLARVASISPSVVTRLERGLQPDLRVSVLLALARALDVTPNDLLLPSGATATSPLVAELTAVMPALAGLPAPEQRRIAAMLRGYLNVPE